MGNPIEDAARKAVNGDDELDDTRTFDGFETDAHGKPSGPAWAQRLNVGARDSDFAPIPTTRELMAQAAQVPLPELPQRETSEQSGDVLNINRLRAEAGYQPSPESQENGLSGSVWRLDQRTAVNFARAQGAFITAQNEFLKDQNTKKIATAQHIFIEALLDVLSKFGVV